MPVKATEKLAFEPAHAVVFEGCVVMAGGVFTVSVAALLICGAPHELLNSARYCLPSSPTVGVNVYVALVAPAIFPQLDPPSVETCHCTAGAGWPVAAAVKLNGEPVHAVELLGLVVTTVATCTVSSAGFVNAVSLQGATKYARYLLPFCAALALKLSVVVVSPGRLLQVVPALVETCHCTLGVTAEVAVAVNDTLPPEQTVWGRGWSVTTGAGPVSDVIVGFARPATSGSSVRTAVKFDPLTVP